MATQTIHLEVALQAEDVVRASWELLLRRAGAVFAAWCLVAGGVFYWALAGTTFDAQAAAAAAAMILGPPAILVALVTWNARRQFLRAENEMRPIHYCFHDDGMDVASVKRSGWIPWEAFQGAVETKSAFLVFLEKDQHYLVPKRCFAEPGEIEGFRSLLRNEVGHGGRPS